MVKTISRKKIRGLLLLSVFAVFPFGQILRIGNFLLLDLVVGVIAVYTLFFVRKYLSWYRYLLYFLSFALFSWFINLFLFKNAQILKSFLYLVRIFIYSLVPVFISSSYKDRKVVLNSLLLVAVITALFGWVQYLFMPDLRSLKIFNWDDHYLRLVGTFLDPGFTSIILVLGAILAINKKKYVIFSFLLLSVLFTYSRAGYLALFVSLAYYFVKKGRTRLIIFITFFCLLFVGYLLPKSQSLGEGLKLNRTSTISARVLDYRRSIFLFKNSPAIGFGYNNLCPAKAMFLNEQNTNSHSCFGLDSSILFVLVTMGVVGLILLGNFGLKVFATIPKTNLLLFTSTVLVVLTHSIFSNSLFYPHVMLWLGVLVGLGGKIKLQTS